MCVCVFVLSVVCVCILEFAIVISVCIQYISVNHEVGIGLRGAHTHTRLLYQQGKVFNQVGTSISGHLKHTKRMQSLVLSYFVILIQMFFFSRSYQEGT